MTMKLSRTLLTGILAMALVSGMALVGCDNGSTDPDPGSGGGGGSLTGSWVDDRANPNQMVLFTNENDAVVSGSKVAYYSNNLYKEATNATGSEVYINDRAYTFQQSGNTLTVNAYGDAPAGGGPRSNVDFTRARGTSGSSIHGIWVTSGLSSNSQYYTMLIIRSGAGVTYTTQGTGANGWGITPYALTSDANFSYVNWGSGPVQYSKNTNPDQLIITLPGAPQRTFITLGGNW
jgi:hypothetical protein